MKKKYFLLLLIILAIFFGCGNNKSMIIKDGLEGIWRTNEPRYRDCSFALTEDLVIFANGYLLEVLDAFLLRHIDVNFILKIKKVEKEGLILYTIYYESMDTKKYKFPFYYDPSDGGTIRFKNQQKMEWRKESKLKFKRKSIKPKWYPT